MKTEPVWENDRLLWKAYVFSLLLHAALFHLRGLALPHREEKFIEIDITHIGSPGLPSVPQKTSLPRSLPKKLRKIIPPKAPPNDVVDPSKHAEPEAKSEPEPPSTSAVSQEYGLGDGSQKVLSQIPTLINLSALSAILKRFYPPEARDQGRQATVILDLHIDIEGRVASVDIVRTGGEDFDQAAMRAVKLLRFTPAFFGSQRVGVKMRQSIQFKLEE